MEIIVTRMELAKTYRKVPFFQISLLHFDMITFELFTKCYFITFRDDDGRQLVLKERGSIIFNKTPVKEIISETDRLIKVLSVSVAKNGKKQLTNLWLLNILKMSKRVTTLKENDDYNSDCDATDIDIY